ncbi:uncharacterized protein [Montipora capricornis]|uniref:uncharacterized protein n=1 Tax=Montipora capricornis TaxID=246305 RepID=UPI0035F1AC40
MLQSLRRDSSLGVFFKYLMASCYEECCYLWCLHSIFCWRRCFHRDEFLLQNFYEEISPEEWKELDQEACKIRGKASANIALTTTNIVSPPLQCHAATKKPENTERCFSLADYSASDFIKIDEDSRESNSTKTRLKSEKFRSYTEPDFISEMWQTRRGATAKLKSLGENFQSRKYARFANKEAEDQGRMEFGYESTAETKSNPRVKMRTKILTGRSQRPKRGMDEENTSESQETSSMFNEAWISFAAHVRRQGPGFSASCTQTLRTCNFTSVKEFYESEVQSNVTFNPLFEDDDSDDDKRRRHTRHRLHTIDEESEAYDSGS